jgi:hypothetical protein
MYVRIHFLRAPTRVDEEPVRTALYRPWAGHMVSPSSRGLCEDTSRTRRALRSGHACDGGNGGGDGGGRGGRMRTIVV